MSLYVAGYYTLLPLVVASAFLWAGWPERAASVLQCCAVLATAAVRSPASTRYSSPEIGVLIVDLMLLAGFVLIAVKSDRQWIIWATAFCAISVLAHVARLVNGDIWRFAYGLLANLAGYPILFAMIIGIVHQARRPAASISSREL